MVSIRDLASFLAAAPSRQMEPPGWGLVGLPTNFVAAAEAHTRSGVLLGFPAEVRFTPVGYRWDFGDGQGLVSAGGGASWAAMGVPEFSETPTGHTFGATGRYTVSPGVVYAAEYRFAGQGWRVVNGTVPVAGAPLSVVIAEERAVLVARDCAANPAGPGC